MSSQRTVYFDLETGGLDPHANPIIQIAAAAVDNATRDVVDQVEVKVIFDPARATAEALEKNHYDEAVWAREAVVKPEALRVVSGFLRAHSTLQRVSRRGKPYRVAQLAGHNAAAFDAPFLQAWYKRANEFLPADFRVLDTLQLALWLFATRPDMKEPENYQLGTLCSYFGVPLGDDAHDALADVIATAKLATALQYACLYPDADATAKEAKAI